MRSGFLPSPEEILKYLNYDSLSGLFAHARNSGNKRTGDPAGAASGNGYIRVSIGGKPYYAHRIAWRLIHGEIPIGVEIDHVNGNRSDNSIFNLRLATHSQQQRNKAVRSDNRAALKGAIYNSRRGRRKHWRSCITVDGVTTHLGWFMTAQEAHEAYVAAATKTHGEFLRVS